MPLLFRAILLLALLAPLRCKNSLPRKPQGKGRTLKLVLDSTLTPVFSPSSSAKTANLSLSPWEYRADCKPSRVPQCLFHAQCLTSGCLNPESGQEDMSLEARPIYYQILVLKRVPRKASRRRPSKQKRYDFRLSNAVVPVGCTCVRPSMLPQI